MALLLDNHGRSSLRNLKQGTVSWGICFFSPQSFHLSIQDTRKQEVPQEGLLQELVTPDSARAKIINESW